LGVSLTFAIRASTSSASSLKDAVSSTVITPKPVVTFQGHPCWNLDASFLEYVSGPKPVLGRDYTLAVWVYWRSSDSGWRTLFRGSNDHTVIVRDGAKNLGMYSNRNGEFRDSGYDISNDMSSWQLVVVTGHGDSSTASTGVSTFYTAEQGDPTVTQRGTADRVASGTTFYRLGWSGQGPGKVAAAYQWSRILTLSEMNSLLTRGVGGDPLQSQATR